MRVEMPCTPCKCVARTAFFASAKEGKGGRQRRFRFARNQINDRDFVKTKYRIRLIDLRFF